MINIFRFHISEQTNEKQEIELGLFQYTKNTQLKTLNNYFKNGTYNNNSLSFTLNNEKNNVLNLKLEQSTDFTEIKKSFLKSNLSSVISKLSNLNSFSSYKKIDKNTHLIVDILRYNPYYKNFFEYKKPYLQRYYINKNLVKGTMILDVLIYIKDQLDSTLSFRRSCREGICGSCAMNINGVNTLACLCLKNDTFDENTFIKILPLPNTLILKDLIPNLSLFYSQYSEIKPWIQRQPVIEDPFSEEFEIETKEFYQTKQNRLKLDGLYECVLCACCSTSCPSYWWNENKYLGPAILLQAYRWIIDSRDEESLARLEYLNGTFRLYRCHTIKNCSAVCPKHLNPAQAIANIKMLIA